MKYPGNCKIFIAHEDAVCLRGYRQQLQLLGYHDITLFDSGLDCIRNMKLNPSIILLDYGMDTPDNRLLNSIKYINPDVHVVLIVPNKSEEIMFGMISNGASDYVVKNLVDPDELRKTLAGLQQRIIVEQEDISIKFPQDFSHSLN